MIFYQFFGITIFLLAVAYFLFARRSLDIRATDFAVIIFGVVIGLSIGALISLPLSRLNDPFGQWLPLIINVFSAAIVTTFFYKQREAIAKSFSNFFISVINATIKRDFKGSPMISHRKDKNEIIVDTSAIIDGRILEISRVGFLNGVLLIPKFVLEELQNIADSPNDLRRGRGRRGLEILSELKKEKNIIIKIIDDDFPAEGDVDAKIIQLAKKKKAKLITVDYNLNRVAQIQNIIVLNVNELNNVLRPVVLPGEKLHIKLIQEGKDKNQGVGYLEDGTMVVVEGGHKFIDHEIEVLVTRVFQTIAGKMIFAVPSNQQSG